MRCSIGAVASRDVYSIVAGIAMRMLAQVILMLFFGIQKSEPGATSVIIGAGQMPKAFISMIRQDVLQSCSISVHCGQYV